MIYITGDTHGELDRFNAPFLKKLKSGDSIIICGDFGFIWDGDENEKKKIEKLSKKKYNILFLDGKHENFDLLNDYPQCEWNEGKVHKISDNIYHLMRGQVFNLDGKSIFTFGGGESLDKYDRISVGKWWEQEMPTIDEMKTAVKNLDKVNRKVDYIITHEPPTAVRNILYGKITNFNMLDAFLDEIVKLVEFRKWFFGCLHIDRKITAKNHAVFQDIIPIEEMKKSKWRFNK